MKKPLVLAASALFVLIGAAYPETPKLAYADEVADSVDPTPTPIRYRPCRPGRGDDRCIQLYERGVRTAYAQWLRGKDGPERETRLAQGGPYEPRPARHSRRHARHDHDERCATAAAIPHRAPPPAPEPAYADPEGGEVRGM